MKNKSNISFFRYTRRQLRSQVLSSPRPPGREEMRDSGNLVEVARETGVSIKFLLNDKWMTT